MSDQREPLTKATEIELAKRAAMENPRRVVACWNLCDGLTTEMIEASKALRAVYAEYREMLAALKEFLCLFGSSDMRPEDECHELAATIRAIIANVEKPCPPN